MTTDPNDNTFYCLSEVFDDLYLHHPDHYYPFPPAFEDQVITAITETAAELELDPGPDDSN